MIDDIVVFILSNGRANNIYTLKSLRKHGYTGDVIFIVDDEDSTIDLYIEKFKKVEIFSKKEISKTFDEFDNFEDRRSIVYARNACFEIAKKIGKKFFIQMDDDYTQFEYRIYNELNTKPKYIFDLDSVFLAMFDFYLKTPFYSIAMAQGGDFIGGNQNKMAKKPTIFRKCMNSFFCSTDRSFKFIGRINEDVNTYTYKQSIGILMGTIPFVSLKQKTTQKNNGGMTELYLDSGTYIKSFYSVMAMPSSVKIRLMGDKHKRLHHHVRWEQTTPKIVRDTTT